MATEKNNFSVDKTKYAKKYDRQKKEITHACILIAIQPTKI